MRDLSFCVDISNDWYLSSNQQNKGQIVFFCLFFPQLTSRCGNERAEDFQEVANIPSTSKGKLIWNTSLYKTTDVKVNAASIGVFGNC